MSEALNSRIVKIFVNQTPEKQAVLRVYAVIVFIVYTWTLFVSLYKLPSWLFFLTAGQVASIYAYGFFVNLVESFFSLLGLLFLNYTLFLYLRSKEEFQTRHILTAFILLISAASRMMYYGGEVFVIPEATWWLVTFALGLPVAIFLPKIRKVREALDIFADRALVFLYLYLPLSFVSIIIILVRNVL